MPTSSQGYRPELDGLRSVAVLAVVFYHFDTFGFDGGFVGVDVFFVLSGFFIGRLLWIELDETGRINYGNFLFRRLRRLAPAYFVMIIAVSVVAYAVLLPFEYRFFGKELISSTVYMSNIMYFREAGYFDVGSDSKILLHTWSLSVEEQFYIFLPLLMLLLARWKGVVLWVIGIIFVGSLVACVIWTLTSPTAAFFLFPFRAWELLAGVLLGIMGHKYGLTWAVHAGLSWIGMTLILGAVIFMPSGASFPGAWAIIPVLGTVLMIFNGGHDNSVNRVLSHRIPVFFGLISYSLYLWHWPIMTLSKYVSDGDQGMLMRAALIGLSCILAWLSWQFIETPTRRGIVAGKALVGGAALASAFTLTSGAAIYLKDGAPGRFSDEIRLHVDATADFLQDWRRCETPPDGVWAGIELCPIGPEGPPEVLIWGDSHVRAFKEGLEAAAWEADVSGLIIWRAGCPPLLGIGKAEDTATVAQNTACARANAQIMAGLAEMPSLKTALFIGRWAYYTEGTGFGRDAHINITVFPKPDSPVTGDVQAQVMKQAWAHSVSNWSGRFEHLYVLRQVPEIADYAARDIARRLVHGHLETAAGLTDISRKAAAQRTQTSDEILASLVPAVTIVDPWPEFCDAQTCSVIHDGQGNYFDNNHITNTGARRVRHLFEPVFQSVNSVALP